MNTKVILGVQKREPANMVWDRYRLDKKIVKAFALLRSNNQKNTNDMVAVQDPHSA
jgi:hypothetical protein